MSKPNVVVVGLLPAQQQRVIRDCGSGVELRFVDQKRKKGGKGMSIPQGDHCVVMTKFIRHDRRDRINGQFASDQIHYCNGGIANLKSTIQGIAQGQNSQAFWQGEKRAAFA